MGTETYSREQLERIFARATELEADAMPSVPPRDGYSLSEMKAIAVQAGIDPALIERVAGEMDAKGEFAAKGLVSQQIEVSFPSPLSEDRALRVLAAVRSSIRQQGTGEVSPSGFSWTSDGGTLLITGHEHAGETHLNVSSNSWGAVIVSGLLGVVAAWITAGTLEPITMGVFFGSVAMGVGVSAALATAAVRKARRRAASVLAAASRTMTDPDVRRDRALLEDADGSAEPGPA